MDIVRRSYLGEHILSLLTMYFYLHPTKILVSSRINVKTYLMRFHPSSSQAIKSCGNKQQWFYKGNCAHFRMLMTHAAPQTGCGTAGVMLELTCVLTLSNLKNNRQNSDRLAKINWYVKALSRFRDQRCICQPPLLALIEIFRIRKYIFLQYRVIWHWTALHHYHEETSTVATFKKLIMLFCMLNQHCMWETQQSFIVTLF